MKIRIKKTLNEGKGADIISRGLTRNLLSDTAKKIINKFGGIEGALETEDILTATELAIGMETGNKKALERNSRAFGAIAKDYEDKKKDLIAKRIQDAEKKAEEEMSEYINWMLESLPGMKWHEILYGQMGGGPYYYAILKKGKESVKDAKEQPTDTIDKQIQDLYKASKRFLDASKEIDEN